MASKGNNIKISPEATKIMPKIKQCMNKNENTLLWCKLSELEIFSISSDLKLLFSLSFTYLPNTVHFFP